MIAPVVPAPPKTAINSAIPKARIIHFYHQIPTPITHLDANYHHKPLKHGAGLSLPPAIHPCPSFRISAAWRSEAAVWSPGNGIYANQDGGEADKEPGTMVFTRWEDSRYSVGTALHVLDIAEIQTNGAASVAAAGRVEGSNVQAVWCSFRLGTGELLENIMSRIQPSQSGIVTGVWIADLAGYGAIPGVGVKEIPAPKPEKRTSEEEEEYEDGESSQPPKKYYEQVPVENASGLFTEYGLGLISVSSEGDVQMFKVKTAGVEPDHHKHQPISIERMAKWKLSPRVALISLRVDNHYNAQKRDEGRPWCIVQNLMGEIWTFSGDPNSPPEVVTSGLSEKEEYDKDMESIEFEIDNGPISDELSLMPSEKRREAYHRITQEMLAERKAKRAEELRLAQLARDQHIQGRWSIIEVRNP